MITQAQIIPEIFGRKTKGSILPETGKDNPGSTLLRFRKETERHPHRQWDPLDKQVGRTGDDLVFLHFGFIKPDPEMGMTGIVASGIDPVLDVGHPVLVHFALPAPDKPFPFGG